MLLEQAGERLAGELAALIGIEDRGCAVAMQRVLDGSSPSRSTPANSRPAD